MEVIDINERNEKRRKNNMLEVIDGVRRMIEEGAIEEFVITSMDKDGEAQIHACCKDLVGGVGLYEIGKHILIQQQTIGDYD